jgi:hypothetical protein
LKVKNINLKVLDVDKNYSAWEKKPFVATKNIDELIKVFVEEMFDFAKRNDISISKQGSGLRRLPRLNEFFTILNYSKKPDNSATRYMKIENGDRNLFRNKNEFNKRPILPVPTKIND